MFVRLCVGLLGVCICSIDGLCPLFVYIFVSLVCWMSGLVFLVSFGMVMFGLVWFVYLVWNGLVFWLVCFGGLIDC